MNVSISEAKGQLTELVRRAEAGEEIVVTRHGRPAARIVPAYGADRPRFRGEVIDEITRRALAKFPAREKPSADHDDLYDESGLPK
jgi:prevent-host-death family protein